MRAQGTCVLSNGQTVPPVNLFTPGSTLWLNLKVKLATFTNDDAAASCAFNATQVRATFLGCCCACFCIFLRVSPMFLCAFLWATQAGHAPGP